jgi:hypothetical protein
LQPKLTSFGLGVSVGLHLYSGNNCLVGKDIAPGDSPQYKNSAVFQRFLQAQELALPLRILKPVPLRMVGVFGLLPGGVITVTAN